MNYIKNSICFGEILWDIFPNEKKIGGAPLNIALRLESLGVKSLIVSQIGADSLGQNLIHKIEKKINTKLISVSKDFPTGKVKVEIDNNGDANYSIEYPSAWDKIKNSSTLKKEVSKTDLFIYGSLACRDLVSRKTLLNLLQYSKFKVLDVNLRPPHYDFSTIEMLMINADFIKFNDDELLIISKKIGSNFKTIEENIKYISEKTKTKKICVTKGDKGAVLFVNNKFYSHNGFKINVVDTVGSGDSFLAVLITEILNNTSPEKSLEKACAVGAIVAKEKGANPKITNEEINSFINTK
tara:strand:- start:1820 stop:2710 length:891 start_codon:yes stop_codon:yes gene_type:complete